MTVKISKKPNKDSLFMIINIEGVLAKVDELNPDVDYNVEIDGYALPTIGRDELDSTLGGTSPPAGADDSPEIVEGINRLVDSGFMGEFMVARQEGLIKWASGDLSDLGALEWQDFDELYASLKPRDQLPQP